MASTGVPVVEGRQVTQRCSACDVTRRLYRRPIPDEPAHHRGPVLREDFLPERPLVDVVPLGYRMQGQRRRARRMPRHQPTATMTTTTSGIRAARPSPRPTALIALAAMLPSTARKIANGTKRLMPDLPRRAGVGSGFRDAGGWRPGGRRHRRELRRTLESRRYRHGLVLPLPVAGASARDSRPVRPVRAAGAAGWSWSGGRAVAPCPTGYSRCATAASAGPGARPRCCRSWRRGSRRGRPRARTAVFR